MVHNILIGLQESWGSLKKKTFRYFQQDQTAANTANNFTDFIHVMFTPSTLASV
jgi:hypothetical protein